MNHHGAEAGNHSPESHSEEEEVFLNEEDVIGEVPVDDEVLPDQDDDLDSNPDEEEADDSVFTFRGHTDDVYTIACSPTDPSLVATGSKDERGFLWTIKSDDSQKELQGHGETVSTVAFSHDGQLLASGSFDGLIQIWDVSSGSSMHKIEGPSDGVEWIRWHPRGHLIIAGCGDTNVWMWNADKNVCLNTFSGHGGTVTCGDFTPDGKTICTGADDGSLRIWDPRTGVCIHSVKGHPYHKEEVICLSVTSDSNVAITGGRDGSIRMVNIGTGKVVGSLDGHSESVEGIGLSSSYPWIASGSLDQKLIIWDLQRSSQRFVCPNEGGVTCLIWLGRSRFIATGCIDGKVRLWDSLSGACVKVFKGHTDTIQALDVTADGNYLVSVSEDTKACVFDISQFK